MMRDYVFLSIIAVVALGFFTHADALPKPPQIKLLRITDTTQFPQKNYTLFTRFDPPHLNNNSVVFRAYSNNQGGVFIYDGQLNNVAFAHQTKTSKDAKPLYHFNIDEDVKTTNTPYILNKQITFLGENRGGFNTMGIYRFYNKQFTTIAHRQTTIPGGAYGLFEEVYSPSIMGNGRVAFIGRNKNILGLYACDNNKDCNVLVDTHTTIPNGTGNFTDIDSPSFSRSSQHKDTVVFLGKGNNNQFGIYLYAKGKITTIANQKSLIPSGLGLFTKFSCVSFDAKTNQIAFAGYGILGQSGLYYYNGKFIKEAADQQTIIPGSFDKFNQFSNITIDNGKILFMASGFKLKEGIFLFVPPKQIYKIVSNLDSIDQLKIKKIELRRDAYDNNQFPMVVTFKNKLSAVYLASLS